MSPAPRLYRALLAWTLLGAAAVLLPALYVVWQVVGIAIAGAALADALLLERERDFGVSRRLDAVLPLGAWRRVELGVRNATARPVRLLAIDHLPETMDGEGLPLRAAIPPGAEAVLRYRVCPRRRGPALFGRVELLLESRLGLWRRLLRHELPAQARVYPNFAEISNFTLLATDNRLSQIGVHRRPRRGEGHEFHQLREYREGDALRQIDWKASSRLRKLISKENEDERDQQLVFLLDCGRRMRHEDSGRAHLDEALNAMLLLTYVALRQGDAVGFLSFAGRERWVPPRKGAGTIPALLEQVYDLESTTRPADYLGAAAMLMPRQRRRALVVVVTNTRDEDHLELDGALDLLRRRHLVVVADLREAILDETLAAPIGDHAAALRFNAVNRYLEERRRHHELLRHRGAEVLDVLASQLPIALVNRYLAIKRSGAL